MDILLYMKRFLNIEVTDNYKIQECTQPLTHARTYARLHAHTHRRTYEHINARIRRTLLCRITWKALNLIVYETYLSSLAINLKY